MRFMLLQERGKFLEQIKKKMWGQKRALEKSSVKVIGGGEVV